METKCIGCNAGGAAPLLTSAVAGKPAVRLRRCGSCGLVFLEDWASSFQAELYDYYERSLHQSKEELYDPVTERRYQQVASLLGRLAPGKRLLDVGCGRGHWVDFTVRQGWDVQGIELAKPAVAICRRFNLPVSETDLFDASLRPGSYDLITMFEVIEHVSRPSSFLERVAELLVPNGVLYLTTPNFDCLDRRVLGPKWPVIYPEHLSYFSRRTLADLVRRSGALEVLQVSTRNTSLPSVLVRRVAVPQRPSPSSGPSVTRSPRPRSPQQQLRYAIEGSRVLSGAKQALNLALDRSGLGSDMIMICRRR